MSSPPLEDCASALAEGALFASAAGALLLLEPVDAVPLFFADAVVEPVVDFGAGVEAVVVLGAGATLGALAAGAAAAALGAVVAPLAVAAPAAPALASASSAATTHIPAGYELRDMAVLLGFTPFIRFRGDGSGR